MAVGTKGARQFQALFDVIPFKGTVDVGNIPSNATIGIGTIGVAGAELGDIVLLADAGGSTGALGVVNGVIYTATVSAANVVTVNALNLSGGAYNPASVAVTGIILKPKGPFRAL